MVVAVLLIALLVAACGGSDADPASAPPPTASGGPVLRTDGDVPAQGVGLVDGDRVTLMTDDGAFVAIGTMKGFYVNDPQLPVTIRVRGRGVTIEKPAHQDPGPTPAAPPPAAPGTAVTGHWTTASKSPDGRWLLAQWSGECEAPTAFFVDVATGATSTATGETGVRWFEAPESIALKWTAGGEALVVLPNGACGTGTSQPGVYAAAPGQRPRLVRAATAEFPSGFHWRRAALP